MGLIIAPLILVFGLATGSVVAALSLLTIRVSGLQSNAAKWVAGLVGMMLGNVTAWILIANFIEGSASEGFYILGFDLFQFLLIGTAVMATLSIVLIVMSRAMAPPTIEVPHADRKDVENRKT